jgi:hypothetical protein
VVEEVEARRSPRPGLLLAARVLGAEAFVVRAVLFLAAFLDFSRVGTALCRTGVIQPIVTCHARLGNPTSCMHGVLAGLAKQPRALLQPGQAPTGARGSFTRNRPADFHS